MKKLILSTLILPFVSLTGFDSGHSGFSNSVEVRTGTWPITIERAPDRGGMSYSIQFRDQGAMKEVVLDTIVFANMQQLKYLDQALTALKKGNNGDVAKFKDYSVGRADKKGKELWYILRDKYGLTDFQQAEADLISKTIKSW